MSVKAPKYLMVRYTDPTKKHNPEVVAVTSSPLKADKDMVIHANDHGHSLDTYELYVRGDV